MSILSFEFLVFVAAAVAVCYLTPRRFRWMALLLASMGFYLFSGLKAAAYLLSVSALTWLTGMRIGALRKQSTDDPSRALRLQKRMRLWLAACLLLVLGAMVCIKYLDALVGALSGKAPAPAFALLAPLGLSYFTFQSAGYVIDVYWGRIAPQGHFLRYLLFVSFFPQIVQGPIATYQQLGPQLMSPAPFHPRRMTMGFQLMLWGYFKKLVLADRLSAFTQAVASGQGQPGWLILLGAIAYAIRLYGDFSGGMDVARGVAMMLGVDLAENFRRPFFALSVADYWRRWHISLGAWFRSYMLYPLSVSRLGAWLGKIGRRALGKQAGRMLPGAFSTFLIFLLIGLWHGANWNAAIYGAYFGLMMGLAMLLEPLFKRLRHRLGLQANPRWWKAVRLVRTMICVLLAQYFAFSAGPLQGFSLLAGTFAHWDFTGFAPIMTGFMSPLEWAIALGAMLSVLAVDFLMERGVDLGGRLARSSLLVRWPLLLTLILAIVVLGHYGEGFDGAAFLYTGF